jgi:hypothetical protein
MKKSFWKIAVLVVTAALVFAACDTGSGTENNKGSTTTVTSIAGLKNALSGGGTKTIKLAVGEYSPTAAELPVVPGSNSTVTILPPDSGEAVIYLPSGYTGDIFQVAGNNTLTLGKEGAAGRIILDGSKKPRSSNYWPPGPLVSAYSTGKFIMLDGVTLRNNTDGGVLVNGGTFEMKGGLIEKNIDVMDGAGVNVYSGGVFTMEGGTISENNANNAGNGGGVCVGFDAGRPGTFTMKGGIIKGNIAGGYGGGVYVKARSFVFEGGTIYGYMPNDTANSNKAGSSNTSGAALYRSSGTAVDWNGNSFDPSVNATINH